ncbi:polysaccharide deacetylase family protein [Nostoc ellipsosporum NOK]|nr:polysaccharide deacetylase family protein [Nostoc ellipsosporum NOK]
MDHHSNSDQPPSGAPLFPYVPFTVFLLAIGLLSCTEKQHSQSLKPAGITKADSMTMPEPAEPVKPGKKKKKIYLTFDDGPNLGTPNVLHIIRDEQIPVTFFVIGEHTAASRLQQATWDSLRNTPLAELCNHSYSHAWRNRYNKFYASPDSVVKDFDQTREMLQLDNRIARTPGRNAWRIDSLKFTDNAKSRTAVDSLQQAGYTVVGWDLEWHFDPKTLTVTADADHIARQIDTLFARNRTKRPDNLVILAHDQAYRGTLDTIELRKLIRKIKQNDNYEFAVVSTYPGVQKPVKSQNIYR